MKCLFILDSDKAGKSERDRYIRDYGMPAVRLAMIGEFVSGVSEIEGLVGTHAQKIITSELGIPTAPTKNQIRRFFQERLASDKIASLGSDFDTKTGVLIDQILKRLGELA